MIPTFSEIANSLLTLPTTPQAIVLRRERRFQFDLDALDRALTNGADALFLCRPNSPHRHRAGPRGCGCARQAMRDATMLVRDR